MIGEPRLLARLPEGPPLLMVVVDTEEEFDWHRPFDRASTAVTNIAAQGLGQAIFTPAGLRPTYVIDYPVAASPEASGILRGFVQAGQALIGTHLHPWVTPPHDEAVTAFDSYAGNLPAALERAKLATMTETIATAFGLRPRIFKAGRYGLGPHTGASLRALGYSIDLSVLPLTDLGNDGGPDFRDWPQQPFWSGGEGDLFCVPMTRGLSGYLPQARLYGLATSDRGRKLRLPGLFAHAGIVERATLTPEGVDFSAHKRLVRALLDQGQRVFTLSYHSPSLVPGHTPYVRSVAERDAFLDTLRRLVDFIMGDLNARPTTPLELRDMAMAAIPPP
jgi:hypothetical protein